MTETRARFDVTIERDDEGLPTRLCYSPSTPVYPAVTLDSHSAPAPCSLCGGAMTAQDDIDVCVCGSRRVRSQAKPAAASRDDVLRGLFAEHLRLLQEMADVSDAWCVAEMARLDTVLGQTEKVK
jgi:hypothetical protein